jgi:hypothetical protein
VADVYLDSILRRVSLNLRWQSSSFNVSTAAPKIANISAWKFRGMFGMLLLAFSNAGRNVGICTIFVSGSKFSTKASHNWKIVSGGGKRIFVFALDWGLNTNPCSSSE